MRLLNKIGLLWIVGLMAFVRTQALADVLLIPPEFDQNAPWADDSVLDQNKEMAQFFRAKESVFKQDWESAKTGLEQYLRDYPAGQLVDEALYWLAQCLNRLSKSDLDTGRMIALREEAVRRINELVERFSKSLWVNDALLLRVEISRDLVLFGRPEFRAYLKASEEINRESYRDISIARSISELTKEAAFPILLRFCETDPSPVVRRKAVFLLGQDYRLDAIPFLQAISINDPDESVRSEAVSVMDRIRMSLIPVQLNYYGFKSRLIDVSEYGQIAENKVNLLTLPHGIMVEKEALESTRVFLGDKLREISFMGLHKGDLDYFGSSSEVWHYFGDFGFNVVNSDLKKEPSRIIGTVRIDDRKSKMKYDQPFSVDAREDKLIIMRRGEDAAMVLLQFEAQTGFQPEAVNRLRESMKNAETMASKIYRTTFVNLLGCKARSTRSNWTSQEQSKSDILDLGPARAEIPGTDGTWILEGQLLCDKKARLFIGRQFTLTNPQGKIVAKGALVEVPADSPQSYQIK